MDVPSKDSSDSPRSQMDFISSTSRKRVSHQEAEISFFSSMNYSRIGSDDTILSPSKPYDSFFDSISPRWNHHFSSNSKIAKPFISGVQNYQRVAFYTEGYGSNSSDNEPGSSIRGPFDSFESCSSTNPIVTTRIFDRDGVFFQSTGKVALRKKISRRDWRSLYSVDWFHSLVDAPTARIVAILFFCYLASILFFAVLHFCVSRWWGCEMAIKNFHEAFMFSLETMATIGYGTKDIFFGDCISVALVLSLQICVKLVADALTIGIIYCRLARPHARASTVIFSNKAVIRRIRGKLYFMFQLCELRKHQLTESHVRLYVLRNEVDRRRLHERVSKPERSVYEDRLNGDEEMGILGSGNRPNANSHYVQSCSMRLSHPSDELGAMVLLMTPQVIVHEIDAQSPLMPPPMWLPNDPSLFTGRSRSSDNRLNNTGSLDGDGAVRWNPPVYESMRCPFYPQMPFESPSGGSCASVNTSSRSNGSGGIREDILEEGIAGMEESRSPKKPRVPSVGLPSPSLSPTPSVLLRTETLLYDPIGLSKSAFPNPGRSNEDFDPTARRNPFLPYPFGGGNSVVDRKGMTRRHSVSADDTTLKVPPSSSPSPSNSSNRSDPSLPSNPGKDRIPFVPIFPAGDTTTNAKYPSNGLYEYACDMNGIELPKKPYKRRSNSLKAGAKKPEGTQSQKWQDEEKSMIQKYMKDRQIEIIAIVEGVDSATGGSVQAKHSFVFDEIEWDKSFEFCVFRDPDDGYTTIDFSRFHELVDVSLDASQAGPIASYL